MALWQAKKKGFISHAMDNAKQSMTLCGLKIGRKWIQQNFNKCPTCYDIERKRVRSMKIGRRYRPLDSYVATE